MRNKTYQWSRRAKKLETIQGGACQTKRVGVVSPQADSSHLETNPEDAREEPCRASHMTGSGVHSGWLLETVCVSNILSTSSKHAAGTSARSGR